jgi:hypothetical protein
MNNKRIEIIGNDESVLEIQRTLYGLRWDAWPIIIFFLIWYIGVGTAWIVEFSKESIDPLCYFILPLLTLTPLLGYKKFLNAVIRLKDGHQLKFNKNLSYLIINNYLKYYFDDISEIIIKKTYNSDNELSGYELNIEMMDKKLIYIDFSESINEIHSLALTINNYLNKGVKKLDN